jgi:hypothetical protein
MTSAEYMILVRQTYDLISAEIDGYLQNNDPEVLMQVFAKFPIMYEFFRFLRGEAFTDHRPHLGDDQQELYRMENDLKAKIKLILTKIDYNNSKSVYYLGQYRRIFDQNYF